MITQPAKVFLPVIGVGVLAAVAYALLTGDHTGVSMFLGLAVAALAGAIAITNYRDPLELPTAADAPAPALRPIGPVRLVGGPGWPAIGALGAGLIAGALIITPLFAAFGAVLLLVAAVGWLGSVSIDRTRRVPNLMPIGIPVVGLFAIASLMFFMSRILLAVPEQASTFIALAVAVVVMAAASFVAVRPTLSPRTLLAGLVVGGLLMAAGGIVAGVAGQRHVEEHHAGPEPIEVAADNVQFTVTELHFEADHDAVIDFDNADTVPHNIAIYKDANFAGLAIFQGAVITGNSKIEYKFKAPGAGEYYFRCDIHPLMQGKVTVA
ncbi:MAG: cupredoxin domain-containing protein [Acidimicrobiales bacterium]